jgi:hypothetical protein
MALGSFARGLAIGAAISALASCTVGQGQQADAESSTQTRASDHLSGCSVSLKGPQQAVHAFSSVAGLVVAIFAALLDVTSGSLITVPLVKDGWSRLLEWAA